ncbi:response regulator transcription factor [Nocardia sp. CDC159]|uniref:Response regulator transcription factor n=1 Tax=Nocardia pulmonis TaxID=2951408 RepID=A0A9X2E9H9_9NOCA|nr:MULTISPECIES: response regulator transcription factor [Nocardia]MCM6776772.1 response regulator transcription factor [Nocardia pulmonis]MCM6789079.1 response regulator transcription factor [Nocardia sp. CDC159]
MTITVLVAEDEALVRAGCVLLLGTAPDIEVVGEAGDGAAAIEAAKTLAPQVVLMDLRMPILDGIGATRAITEIPGAPAVLVLTTFHEDTAVQEALAAGASGFLLKQAAPADLVQAVRRCAAGEGWLDPAIVGGVLGALRRAGPRAALAPTTLSGLTAREQEVLRLMALGRSNTEISAELFISEATTRTHVAHVIAKTHSRDRTQAVVLAYQSGLMS